MNFLERIPLVGRKNESSLINMDLFRKQVSKFIADYQKSKRVLSSENQELAPSYFSRTQRRIFYERARQEFIPPRLEFDDINTAELTEEDAILWQKVNNVTKKIPYVVSAEELEQHKKAAIASGNPSRISFVRCLSKLRDKLWQ